MKTILTLLILTTVSACAAGNDHSPIACEDPTKPGYSKSKYMMQKMRGECDSTKQDSTTAGGQS